MKSQLQILRLIQKKSQRPMLRLSNQLILGCLCLFPSTEKSKMLIFVDTFQAFASFSRVTNCPED